MYISYLAGWYVWSWMLGCWWTIEKRVCWLKSENDSHWRSLRGENFQSCRGGGINSTAASLHSFIKCLTILPIPVLINLLNLSPPTHTHTRSWVNTHTLRLCRLCEGVYVCVCVYSAPVLCPWGGGGVAHVRLNSVGTQMFCSQRNMLMWCKSSV